MKKYKLLIVISFFIHVNLNAQNAGITSIGSSISCPCTVIMIPLYVLHSPPIGSFTLSINYDGSVLSAIQNGNNGITFLNINDSLPSLSGSQLVNVFHPNLKRTVIIWYAISPINLDTNLSGVAKICDIPYRYFGGTTSLILDNSDAYGQWCEYSGATSILIDTPTVNFYINGSVTQTLPPVIQGNISGNPFPCVGSYSQYNVVGSSGISYTWTAPGTWSGLSDSSSINYLVGSFTTDSVIVAPVNACGDTGNSVSLIVNVNTIPALSGSITATDSTPCVSTFQTFSVMNIPGATYTWTAPSTWIGTSTTNSISYQIGAFSYDTVFVTAGNICGESPPLSILVHDCSLNISGNSNATVFSIYNYPNPFSNETTVEFFLPEPGFVTIDIFNIFGEHLLNVADNYFIQGKHEVSINMSNYSSGIYSYTVKYINKEKIVSKTCLISIIK